MAAGGEFFLWPERDRGTTRYDGRGPPSAVLSALRSAATEDGSAVRIVRPNGANTKLRTCADWCRATCSGDPVLGIDYTFLGGAVEWGAERRGGCSMQCPSYVALANPSNFSSISTTCRAPFTASMSVMPHSPSTMATICSRFLRATPVGGVEANRFNWTIERSKLGYQSLGISLLAISVLKLLATPTKSLRHFKAPAF